MGRLSFLPLVIFCSTILSTATGASPGGTNEWLKPTSGYWEEAYWSLGPPSMDQDLIAFRNANWKALAIGRNTTVSNSSSLSIKALLVEAPPYSFNQLLLNFAGLDVPLFVGSNLTVGTNGSLVSHYSALRGSNFIVGAAAAFMNGSKVSFTNIFVGTNAGSGLTVSNSDLFANRLQVQSATVTQSGGSNQINNLEMLPASAYTLFNGSLKGDAFELQSLGILEGAANFTQGGGSTDFGVVKLGRFSYPAGPPFGLGEILMQGGNLTTRTLDCRNGSFTQFGGTHTNSSLTLWGVLLHPEPNPDGYYFLSGGLLVSDVIAVIGGSFGQTGGTNYTRELSFEDAGSYHFSAGELVTSNTTISTVSCVQGVFTQSAGNHRILNRLLLDDFVNYDLRGGTLSVSNIDISAGGQLVLEGGTISNTGLCTIRGGAVRVAGPEQRLGQLQVIGVLPQFVCSLSQPTNSMVDMLPSVGAVGVAVVRFRDSRDVPWSGTGLIIADWNPTPGDDGPDHIFVGTNSQGLTSAQLSQITFANPRGLPMGNYPAAILSTGELVPATPPPIGFATASGRLILSWGGPYQLRTATNVIGPYGIVAGASSPYTNLLSEPQRYFLLRLPSQ